MKLLLSFLLVFASSFVSVSKKGIKLKLLETKQLHGYPSASSIQLYKDRLYVMGDDAKQLLVLDKQYNKVDSIELFKSDQPRIPKNIKADLEGSAIIEYQGSTYLLLCGSGATDQREKLVLVGLDNGSKVIRFSLFPFLEKAKRDLEDINIEGCAVYKDRLILSNRANKTSKQNHLILTDHNFFIGHNKGYRIIPVEMKTDSIIGISSLQYLPKHDWLLFTATIEDTPSSYEDGAIGDSYLGIIKNFSAKDRAKAISPDELINLSLKMPALKQKKIEGLTVEDNGKGKLLLHLVSDNDNGESEIYKVKMKFDDR